MKERYKGVHDILYETGQHIRIENAQERIAIEDKTSMRYALFNCRI